MDGRKHVRKLGVIVQGSAVTQHHVDARLSCHKLMDPQGSSKLRYGLLHKQDLIAERARKDSDSKNSYSRGAVSYLWYSLPWLILSNGRSLMTRPYSPKLDSAELGQFFSIRRLNSPSLRAILGERPLSARARLVPQNGRQSGGHRSSRAASCLECLDD